MTTTNQTDRTPATRGHLRAVSEEHSAEVPRNIHGGLHGQEVEREVENYNPSPQGSVTGVAASTETPPQDQGGEKWISGDPTPKWCDGLIKRIRTEYARKQWDNPDGTPGVAVRELVEALAPHGRAAATEAVNTIIRTHPGTDRFPPPTSAFHQLAKQSADATRRRAEDHAREHAATHGTHVRAPKSHAWLAAGILYANSGINLAGTRAVQPFAAIARAHGLDTETLARLVETGQGFPQAATDDAEVAWIRSGRPEPPAASGIAGVVAS